MPRKRDLKKLAGEVPFLLALPTIVDPSGFGETIADAATPEQALTIIKSIDAAMQDYEFTLNLARWCVEELKKSSPPEEPFSLAELE